VLIEVGNDLTLLKLKHCEFDSRPCTVS